MALGKPSRRYCGPSPTSYRPAPCPPATSRIRVDPEAAEGGDPAGERAAGPGHHGGRRAHGPAGLRARADPPGPRGPRGRVGRRAGRRPDAPLPTARHGAAALPACWPTPPPGSAARSAGPSTGSSTWSTGSTSGCRRLPTPRCSPCTTWCPGASPTRPGHRPTPRPARAPGGRGRVPVAVLRRRGLGPARRDHGGRHPQRGRCGVLRRPRPSRRSASPSSGSVDRSSSTPGAAPSGRIWWAWPAPGRGSTPATAPPCWS